MFSKLHFTGFWEIFGKKSQNNTLQSSYETYNRGDLSFKCYFQLLFVF
jgi:hypothetical protein